MPLADPATPPPRDPSDCGDAAVTRLLREVEAGRAEATDELFRAVYENLRRHAERRLASERPGHTLQATALVHDAYVRLIGDEPTPEGWGSRAQFLAAACQAMRRILIEHARARGARKRGGDFQRLSLDAVSCTLDDVPPEVIDLDAALEAMQPDHPQAAELVKLRFFGGLTMADAAEVLGMSLSGAERTWRFARAWLYARLA